GDPNHYLFMACENGDLDPKKPQKSWRTAWRNLTRAIECPACGCVQQPAKTCCKKTCHADTQGVRSATANLSIHDLRQHAITELAESQASDQTIMSIAGHVSREMLDHYSHVRLEAKRRAVEALVTKWAETRRLRHKPRHTAPRYCGDTGAKSQKRMVGE